MLIDENAPLPQPDAAPQRGRGGATWLLWLSVLVVAYPLSLGPAVKLYEAVPATRLAIATFYSPLKDLMYRIPPLQKAMEWYMKVVWKFP